MSFTSCVTVVSAERERGEKLPDVDLGERVAVTDKVMVAENNFNAWLVRRQETCHDWRAEYEIIEHQQTRHPQWFFFVLGLVATGVGAGLTYHGVVNKKDGEDIPATLAIGPIVLGGGVLASLFYLLRDENDSRTVTLEEREKEPYSKCTSTQLSTGGERWRMDVLGSDREGETGSGSSINLKSEAEEVLATRKLTTSLASELADDGIPYRVMIGNSSPLKGTIPSPAMNDEFETWGAKQSETLSPELAVRWDACGAFGLRGSARLRCFSTEKGKEPGLYEATDQLAAVRSEGTAVMGAMHEFKIDQKGEFELMISRTVRGTEPWLVQVVNEETGEVALSQMLKSGTRHRLTGKLSRSGEWALAVIGPIGLGQRFSAAITMVHR